LYNAFFKRILDFTLALLGFVILSPIFIAITILLFFANEGKPFFIQLRPGKDERLFKIIKFKTMNDKKDDQGNLLSDSKRLSKIGIFVRKTSLDEIPQLINVLWGDMSFIGPRPLLIKYLPYYTGNELLRHSIRPGITGLAQVSGRNTLNWDERLALDVRYVENITLINDITIILQSIKAVLFSKGVSLDPNALMKDLDDERNN